MTAMRNHFKHDKRLDAARRMPALRHSIPGEEFDILDSEAAEWLASQSEIRQYLFDKAKQLDLIRYDRESGAWSGAATEEDEA